MMSDEKNDVAAGMDLLQATVGYMVGQGFKPLTIIAALVDSAIGAAYGMPGWTPDDAKEFLGSRLESSAAIWDRAFPGRPAEPDAPRVIKIERELELRVFLDTINAVLKSQGRPKMCLDEVRGWFDEFDQLREKAANIDTLAKDVGLGR